jgi:GT2 family glycosyltransferase
VSVNSCSTSAQRVPGVTSVGHRLKVSVVICCYVEHRWTELLGAVASIRRQTRPPLQVVVVVDHNPELFARVCRALPDVLALESLGAPGLSGARNTGINAATGDIVAFLDDDAAAEPEWLQRLTAPYANPRILGVGGFIEPRWACPPPAWFPDEFRWVVGCSYLGLPPHGGPVRNLIGANMSFRRAAFEAIGGFRSELGHQGRRPGGDEETELCIRLRQRWPGTVLLYVPSARVHHRVPVSRASFGYFRDRCFAEGRAKARVARLVGASDGLASERSYTLTTLPGGVLRGLDDGFRRRESAGLARAGAIIAGLALTCFGYALQTVAAR